MKPSNLLRKYYYVVYYFTIAAPLEVSAALAALIGFLKCSQLTPLHALYQTLP
jgi:hypothetical protein